MSKLEYSPDSKLTITRTYSPFNSSDQSSKMINKLKCDLNIVSGCLFISNYELPNRYSQWTIGFKNPIIVLEATDLNFVIKALQEKGIILLDLIWTVLQDVDYLESINLETDKIIGTIKHHSTLFSESDRLRKPSLISLVRSIQTLFFNKQESFLGLYGSFGYDLIFGFEDINKIKQRDLSQRDIVLYLPDNLLVIDHLENIAGQYHYDFMSSHTLDQTWKTNLVLSPYMPSRSHQKDSRELVEGDYQKQVEDLNPHFKNGDMFECVLSQTRHLTTIKTPSAIFTELLAKNPAPYSFLINLGKSEFLVGASPEMFVRVTSTRIETCPISGTISRGSNALEESENMLELLNSEKECSELVMCVDIDRNDKSRISIPGTVKVISHREIEKTSRLLHTVDHVEGYLQPQCDGLDALCVHLWAVTVTGAPKKIAVEYIEQHEASPRKWYGGAVGIVHFNGNINTGLTLRTLHLQNGIVNLRTGATLLYDSDPKLEERETELKAAALIDIVKSNNKINLLPVISHNSSKRHLSLLVIDFNDSFVHTISSYFSELVDNVVTVRYYHLKDKDQFANYDAYILSPGPKHPKDYPMKWLLDIVVSYKKPILGICLGHQAIIEYYGGQLEVLYEPIHGKKSLITIVDHLGLFKKCTRHINVGRYHSLIATVSEIPGDLIVSSNLKLELENKQKTKIVMSVRHHQLPIFGIQFHLESILTENEVAHTILNNFLDYC